MKTVTIDFVAFTKVVDKNIDELRHALVHHVFFKDLSGTSTNAAIKNTFQHAPERAEEVINAFFNKLFTELTETVNAAKDNAQP